MEIVIGIPFALLCTWANETELLELSCWNYRASPSPGLEMCHDVLRKSEGKNEYKTAQFELDTVMGFCLGTTEQEVHPKSKKVISQ